MLLPSIDIDPTLTPPIPVMAPPGRLGSPPNTGSGAESETLSILIADDDEGDRKMMRRTLTQSDMRCIFVETKSVQEAIAACATSSFDCVFLDYRLPDQDGLAGLTCLHERFPYMAIIMMTGQGDELVATEAIMRGASDYLPKGRIQAHELKRSVAKAMEKANLQRTIALSRDELIKSGQEKEVLIASLGRALAEKTVLLKEVHHRIKNNLAVISSLLGVQAGIIGDERLTFALEKSQQRIESMVLIHEYLYSTEHLDRVNIGHYLEELTAALCSSYSTIADQVSAAVYADDIDLPADLAVPCALILNEWFSNALKYAFPGGIKGQINVRFVRLESGALSLSCRDDGVGIPATFDWRHAKSMGLSITQALAKQIGGTVTLDSSHGGTAFELIFPAVPLFQQPAIPAQGA